MMELCQLTKVKHSKTRLVQLAIGAKQKVTTTEDKWKVTQFTVDYEFKLQGHKTIIKLTFLPLGSYDMIIGTHWL